MEDLAGRTAHDPRFYQLADEHDECLARSILSNIGDGFGRFSIPATTPLREYLDTYISLDRTFAHRYELIYALQNPKRIFLESLVDTDEALIARMMKPYFEDLYKLALRLYYIIHHKPLIEEQPASFFVPLCKSFGPDDAVTFVQSETLNIRLEINIPSKPIIISAPEICMFEQYLYAFAYFDGSDYASDSFSLTPSADLTVFHDCNVSFF
ncbi:hypothetical protein WOB59_00325 [Methylocystis sp. IM4]|uniref:hypothetical protein n=1 Tax=Methylocystis sp. IM4 TaxID=3136560 RepID=UPI003119B3ED